MAKRLTFAAVQATLREHGVTIFRTAEPGEFRVRLTDAPPRTGYYTTDLQDALDTGKAMARERDVRLHAAAGGRQHYETAMRLAAATNRL
jgi:hypothetical protein